MRGAPFDERPAFGGTLVSYCFKRSVLRGPQDRSSRPVGPLPKRAARSFYPFRPAVDADNLALDQHFAEAVTHGGVVGVFRTQLNVVVM